MLFPQFITYQHGTLVEIFKTGERAPIAKGYKNSTLYKKLIETKLGEPYLQEIISAYENFSKYLDDIGYNVKIDTSWYDVAEFSDGTTKRSLEINVLDFGFESIKNNKKIINSKSLIIENSRVLKKLYNSNDFVKFLETILGLKKIYPYADTLSSINYNYYKKNQQLGWHFDNASFAITLMIQSAPEGGEFEYISEGRDSNKDFIDKDIISKIISGSEKPNKLNANDGTLILFYGRNYLHRVTPVISKKCRILVTLNYNLEVGIELSENARLTFFGRI